MLRYLKPVVTLLVFVVIVVVFQVIYFYPGFGTTQKPLPELTEVIAVEETKPDPALQPKSSEVTVVKEPKIKPEPLPTSSEAAKEPKIKSEPVVIITGLDKQLHCLAKNIYHEAKGESYEGKLAVAQVTINRVESGRFPQSVCGVVEQMTKFQDRIVCQFSWYCTNARNYIPKQSAAWLESIEIASKVLYYDLRLESMTEALYFHSSSINPNWNKILVGKIGNHLFFTDRQK